jgi:DNA invertase Pin-like site-specific DNA recombinase
MGICEMKAALYVRVSTDKQELGNQLAQLRDYCQKSGYEIYAEFQDITSGKDNSRPGFDALFSHAHKKEFDIVIFWALDRFSRSGTLFTLQKLKELENLGIQWHSYTEQYFSSAGQFKDVVISIMATLAKIEREKISERTKAGLAHAQNVGKRGKDKKPRKTRADRGFSRH